MATTTTGVVVWLVGKLGLSSYVQLLPLPVVGGYLGYIGYFCLAAGASLGTGLNVDSFTTWAQFFVTDTELLSKLALTVGFAFILYYIAYRVEHVVALPGVLVATPILFFVILFLFGIPLDDARAHGWLPYPDSDPTWGMQCFRLYRGFQGIDWRAVIHELPTMVGLFCVVSFGSVLDIAAIQTEQPTPLDFDGELRMIGATRLVNKRNASLVCLPSHAPSGIKVDVLSSISCLGRHKGAPKREAGKVLPRRLGSTSNLHGSVVNRSGNCFSDPAMLMW